MSTITRPVLYDQVLKQVRILDRIKEVIISSVRGFNNLSFVELEKQSRQLDCQFDVVTELQEAMFTTCTAEQIHAIVNQIPVGSFLPEPLERRVLPKDIYCTYEQWSKDPKLQALMPNKKF